jgi:hypothetical protein
MKKNSIKLPTGYFETDHLREEYEYFKGHAFEYLKWKPRAALIDKNGKTSRLYTGQKYDPNFIDLVENGWMHDHCGVCSITLTDVENEFQQTSGYFNGFDWLCKWCYENIIAADDIEKRISELLMKE